MERDQIAIVIEWVLGSMAETVHYYYHPPGVDKGALIDPLL